jgi:hypothetical protein
MQLGNAWSQSIFVQQKSHAYDNNAKAAAAEDLHFLNTCGPSRHNTKLIRAGP